MIELPLEVYGRASVATRLSSWSCVAGTLTVTLRAGKIAYKCTVTGHASYGMKGKLTVT